MTPQPIFRIHPHDKVEYNGTSWRAIAHGKEGTTLRCTEDLEIFDTISHEKLARLIKGPHFKIWPGHYSEKSARFRNMGTEELIANQPIWQQEAILDRLFCVQRWLTEEDQGNVKRTLIASAVFLKELELEMMKRHIHKMQPHKKKQTGQKVTITFGPSFDSLMRWVRTYEKSGCNPLSLKDNRCNSGNRNRKFSDETYAFVDNFILAYAAPNGGDACDVAKNCLWAIDDENKERLLQGQPLLGKLSVRQIERYISKLPKFLVDCQRLGIDRARNKYGSSSGGLDTLLAGERYEMDGWKGDVMVLLRDAGIDSQLSPELLKRIPRGRVWVYVVIDHATRCVVGLRVVLNGTADDTVRVLEMATRDKTAISNAVGTHFPWKEGGGFLMLVSDQGSEFANDRCETAVLTVLSAYERNPAAAPSLRGVNERLFGVFSRKLMPMISGRTYANIYDRGDIDPKSTAALTPDQLLRILILYVVDIYHRTPHSGIHHVAPSDKWAELTKVPGITPPPDGYRRRSAFGERIVRQVEGHGVLINGIRYINPELHEFFKDQYKCDVNICIDPYDISWVLVQVGTDWVAVYSAIEDLEGVTSEEWSQANLARKKKGLKTYEQDLPAIRLAISKIKELNSDAAKLAGLTDKVLTGQYVDNQDIEVFNYEEIIPWGDPEQVPEAGDVFGEYIQTGEEAPLADNPDEIRRDAPEKHKKQSRWSLGDD